MLLSAAFGIFLHYSERNTNYANYTNSVPGYTCERIDLCDSRHLCSTQNRYHHLKYSTHSLQT